MLINNKPYLYNYHRKTPVFWFAKFSQVSALTIRFYIRRPVLWVELQLHFHILYHQVLQVQLMLGNLAQARRCHYIFC
ncbi:hypothetical protein VCSRO12_2237 [Vibrio cholerae]|nr:hypothetical protein VCSRO62_0152 [Vibrio cholerae]GHY08221.1 hypothetical protein VCSRO112_1886 [Vibrio cholerae]GHY65802.1 hypothetical protein VCSRO12_2237 [Vibrio cholerae]